MRINEIFLGKPLHWALWIVIAVLLYWFNSMHLHVIHFNIFIFALLAISTAVVLTIVFTYKPGDRITREPFDDGEEVGGLNTED